MQNSGDRIIRVVVFEDPFAEEKNSEAELQDLLWSAAIARSNQQNPGLPQLAFRLENVEKIGDALSRDCDVCVLDYGALGLSGMSTLAHSWSDQIIEHAEENPSRYFVLASFHTREAMRDFLYDSSKTLPANLYLDEDKFLNEFVAGDIYIA